MRKFFPRLGTAALGLALLGCSVTQYLQTEEIQVDSSGISEEVSGKFEITENSTAAPAAAAAAEAKEKKSGKGKKGGKLDAASKKKKEFEFEVRRGEKIPFGPGEHTTMAITYMGVEAGTFELSVLPYKYVSGRKVFHLRGHGYSTAVFALFYRVDDVGESFMDYDGLFTHKFQLKVDESRQNRDLVEFYDQKAHVVHFWDKLVHTKKGLRITQFTKETMPYAQDAMTAAFYLRTLPLEVGKSYVYPMVTNGKVWQVKAKVLRKEELVTEIGKIPAIVIEPETSFEGVIKTTGKSFIWLSDDEHRNFLKIDAKVKIGSVIAYLKKLKQGDPHAQ